jgi:hypothetical protein
LPLETLGDEVIVDELVGIDDEAVVLASAIVDDAGNVLVEGSGELAISYVPGVL